MNQKPFPAIGCSTQEYENLDIPFLQYHAVLRSWKIDNPFPQYFIQYAKNYVDEGL